MAPHCVSVNQERKEGETGFDVGAGNRNLEVVKLMAETSLQPWVYTILYLFSVLYEQFF